MFFFRNIKKHQRGEIATVLTLLSVGLMLAGIIAGTQLAKSPQNTRSEAVYPTWDWDGAANKCTDSDNKGFCICHNLGSDLCQPVCTTNGLSQKCIANKWADPNDANAWGCWGNATYDCRPGQNTPPTPTPGGGGNPPANCTDGEWICNGVAPPDTDTKNLFCSVWCDGRNQWLWQAANNSNACGGKPSKPTSEGCPLPPSNTPPPGRGGGSSPTPIESPTPIPTATPDPDGTYGKYVIIDKNSNISSSNTDLTQYLFDITSGSSLNFSLRGSDHINDNKEEIKFIYGSTSNTGTIHHLDNYLIYEIIQRTKDLVLDEAIFHIYKSGVANELTFSNRSLNVCNPDSENYSDFTQVPEMTSAELISACMGKLNPVNLNIDTDADPPPPSPTSVPGAKTAYYLFGLEVKGNAIHRGNPVKIDTNTIKFSRLNDIIIPSTNYGIIDLLEGSDAMPIYTLPEDNKYLLFKTNGPYTGNLSVQPVFNVVKINGTDSVGSSRSVTINPCESDNDSLDLQAVLDLCYSSSTSFPTVYLTFDGQLSTPTPVSGGTPSGGTPAPTGGGGSKITLSFNNSWATSWTDSSQVDEYKASISITDFKVVNTSTTSLTDTKCASGVMTLLPKTQTDTKDCVSIDEFHNSPGNYALDVIGKVEIWNKNWPWPDKFAYSCPINYVGTFVSVPTTKLNFYVNYDSTNINEDGNITCTITNPPGIINTAALVGSTNVDINNTIKKWENNEIGPLEMSSFINQLTRTPGLQVNFCDPVKGECSAGF